MIKLETPLLDKNTKFPMENMSEKQDKKVGFKHYYVMNSATKLKIEKLKNTIMIVRSRVIRKKMSLTRVVMGMVLIWGCFMQLTNLTQFLAPKVNFSWIFTKETSSHLPITRVYENNGYLMVSSNGGLNQMRAGICDMVSIARYLNITLIVPELDKTSFWNDQSEFQDIFDVDYFINSLKDEVQILIELPPHLKKRADDSGTLFSMPPISWSNLTYYDEVKIKFLYVVFRMMRKLRDCNYVVRKVLCTFKGLLSTHMKDSKCGFSPHTEYKIEEVSKTVLVINLLLFEVLPRIKENTVILFNKSDSRLANNGLPIDIQKFRCRVNYESLRFTHPIEELGKRIINLLKKRGPYLVLHLRYEMDMLAFSGCTEGCNAAEIEELTSMRYAYPWWKEKVINSEEKRKSGLCPLTPEETSISLQALGINQDIQIYIAAGDIYGGENRLSNLSATFPNLVKKETLLPYSDIAPFMNHSSQMAALDYMVSIESDIFIPTYGGNMAKLVEGHRRYLGYRKTINLDRMTLVQLIDQHKNGSLTWNQFSRRVRLSHKHRMGGPQRRLQIPGKPKLEDYFYTNPHECLPQYAELN